MIICCFGNSLTAGYPGYNPPIDGVSRGYGNFHSQYEYWLKHYCIEYIEEKTGTHATELAKNLIFINKGIPGDTSKGLLHRIERDMVNLEPKPRYSIIIIGTNDLGWGLSNDKIFWNIKKLHQISRENGVYSIGGLIPPVTKRGSTPHWTLIRSDFNDKLVTFFTEMDIPFTTYNYMVDEEGYLKQDYTSGDGVHFSVAGYERMGYSLFQDVLKRMLDERILGDK